MSDSPSSTQHAALLEAGNQALEACDWPSARTHFQSALSLHETPEALEGLGMTAWWLDDSRLLFESRERAFALYRRQDDIPGAARMAIWLALDNYIFRHAPAMANGWLRRAERLLVAVEQPVFEHCFMSFTLGHIALENFDTGSTIQHAAKARELASELGIVDFEMLALALEGLAHVSEGRVEEGMGQLDEAVTAALAGELTDPDAIVTSCCYLFYACERVRDFRRAAQWCQTLTDLCRRWSYRSMVSVCRAHYAGILIWQGDWDEAERELTVAVEELLAGRAGWAPEGLLRLAELRRLQGRTQEAAELFDATHDHPLSLIGRAEIAYERNEFLTASDLIARFSRRVHERTLTERVAGLELQLRIGLALHDDGLIHGALADLQNAEARLGTDPIRAAVTRSQGLIAAANESIDEARRCFEDAVDLFLASGSPFEAACSRLELARALGLEGRVEIAAAECRAALDVFHRLGAHGQTTRAGELLRELGSHGDPSSQAPHYPGLSRRETEILHYIAIGRTNPQIAEELFLSVRTVERHVSSIYQKIGAEGRAARAIATAFALEHDSPGQSG